MDTIPVDRFQPMTGHIEWGKPDSRGESPVSIDIPLQPFDSGLSYLPQPESTRILLYEFSIPAPSPHAASGHTFDLSQITQGGSVYIGCRHNPVDIQKMTINHIDSNRFEVDLQLFIDFEHEGVGRNETVQIVSNLIFNEKAEPGD